jgi:flagellar hook assembly protein FlgD
MPAVSSVTVDWQGDPSGVVESEVQVIDLNGRVLRREALGHEPGGSWTWDGRDGAMRPVPAGVYFLRLVSGARHATSRVVFIR